MNATEAKLFYERIENLAQEMNDNSGPGLNQAF